ncbi:MAG: hypothetical protein HFJ17_03275 [Clostridia bacterium]|nr:hypothetical protein [Clostridia bacterium]
MANKNKEWRLPAKKNYHGKLTMLEIRAYYKEFNNGKELPEMIVDNSGEFNNKVKINEFGSVMDVKAENGGNPDKESAR